MHGTTERNPERREPLFGTGSVPLAVEMGADPEALGGGELPVEGDFLSEKADGREEVLVLRRRPSEHTRLPRRRASQPREQSQERRLAVAVGPTSAEMRPSGTSIEQSCKPHVDP